MSCCFPVAAHTVCSEPARRRRHRTARRRPSTRGFFCQKPHCHPSVGKTVEGTVSGIYNAGAGPRAEYSIDTCNTRTVRPRSATVSVWHRPALPPASEWRFISRARRVAPARRWALGAGGGDAGTETARPPRRGTAYGLYGVRCRGRAGGHRVAVPVWHPGVLAAKVRDFGSNLLKCYRQ